MNKISISELNEEDLFTAGYPGEVWYGTVMAKNLTIFIIFKIYNVDMKQIANLNNKIIIKKNLA